MIVSLDTNVQVSAFHFASRRGVPVLALEKAVKTCTIATCDAMEEELRRVLTTKFGWSVERVESALAGLLQNSIRVSLDGSVKLCRDPKDDMFLECVFRAEADLLVSGDQDLLALGSFHNTRIVTPAQFLSDYL